MEPLLILALNVFVVVVAALVGREILIRLIVRVTRRAGAAPSVVSTISGAVSVIALVLAAVALSKILGLSSDLSILTFSGVLGLVFSLALQSTLSNIIAGLLLFSDNTLRLNDVIECSGIKGTVARVGFRSTWVRNEQGVIVVFSNSTLAAGPLTNHTATQRLEKKISA